MGRYMHTATNPLCDTQFRKKTYRLVCVSRISRCGWSTLEARWRSQADSEFQEVSDQKASHTRPLPKMVTHPIASTSGGASIVVLLSLGKS